MFVFFFNKTLDCTYFVYFHNHIKDHSSTSSFYIFPAAFLFLVVVATAFVPFLLVFFLIASLKEVLILISPINFILFYVPILYVYLF